MSMRDEYPTCAPLTPHTLISVGPCPAGLHLENWDDLLHQPTRHHLLQETSSSSLVNNLNSHFYLVRGYEKYGNPVAMGEG